MASNLKVNDECVIKYNAMKDNRAYGYLIMCIKDNKEVVVVETGDPFPRAMTQDENKNAFKEVAKKLLDNEMEPMYVIFDFLFEDGKGNKLVFLNWCSDSSPFKKKMLQGSTYESLKKSFPGLVASIEANDHDELEYDNIRKDVLAGKK